MARLPLPGSDDGQWGTILNDFLSVEHATDGSLKIRTDGTLSFTKADVGLGNVDNTSDANKPVSTATQNALNLKANTADAVLLAGGNSATITNNALANGFAQINLDYTPNGSTPDAFAFYHNGNRTGYHNEKGELRSRAAADNSVPFRVQQRSATQSANLTEWTESNNTILAYVASDGRIHAPNLDASTWQTFSYPANAAAAAGFATAGVRLEPLYNVARLRGAIQITAPGFSADATLATIPVGYRPPSTFRVSTRFAGTGAAGAFITVNTDGTIACSASLTNSNNILHLDGIVYPL
jgi:hypothetical protein